MRALTPIHKQVALQDAEPGMILSDDVFDPQGQILLPAKTVLSEKTLASLARHDVEWLHIEAGHMSPEEESAQHAYYAQRIPYLFRQPDDSPAAALLQQYLRKYRLGEEA